jgi:hypothetical protein
MIEIGGTYHSNGAEYLCIAIHGGHAWMKSSEFSSAYVWAIDGKSRSLSSEYDISFDPRDVEIARLKARIADLEAAQHHQEPLMGPRHDK